MRNQLISTKTLVVVAVAALISIVCLGSPEQDQPLVAKVDGYITELYKTVNGSDGAKASFLTNGFCFNGTLEQLAVEAQSADDIVLVENLGRDCRIVSGLLQS